MAPIPALPSPWRGIQIPRPLQKLFDRFPLLTYDANELPERSRHLTTSPLPTLYVFCTEEDARLGLPSFNPGCLKWQTLLRLAKVQFRILPSTNHASPTGALPFLLPPRKPSSSPTSNPPTPIPADKLLSYARQHGNGATPSLSTPDHPQPSRAALRSEAYLSLITLHLRNAWLHALYLDPSSERLLRALYVRPASSSPAVQAALLRRLRRAAAEQIATSGGGSLAVWAADAVDEDAVYASAGEALGALASLLRESETGWFFGAAAPGEFDATLFSYTHLMMEFMTGGGTAGGEGHNKDDGGVNEGGVGRMGRLGDMVRAAGEGELARHRERMLEAAWPGWDGKRKW